MRVPAQPPDPQVTHFKDLQALLPHLVPTLPDGRYLHWDDLRRRSPPKGLSREQWWFAQSIARSSARVPIPGLLDTRGRQFWFCRLDAIDRATHQLDRRDAVREMLERIGDDEIRTKYRIDQLMEEAINSSLIEGARLTTRAEAKAMIREGHTPHGKGERMVFNNYQAMQRLLDVADKALGPDDLLEIHALLGADALDSPGAEARLRTAADDVRVEDVASGDVWFTPPPASELEQRLDAMLSFANDAGDGAFLHPLVRAITLHFWMAYLHPFVDGNGRMARALFYWQMLRSKYDFAQYLSISGPIERSRRAYYRAFVLTETDNGDLTYFLLHQLGILQRATDDLIKHLAERAEKMKAVPRVLSQTQTLNRRQQFVLADLIDGEGIGVTVKGHANSHAVSYLTARKDLQELEQAGLLGRVRAGKTDRYLLTEGTKARLIRATRH